MSLKSKRQVAILVETSFAAGRQIFAGISRFLHEKDCWSVFPQTGPLDNLNLQALRSWRGEGVIACIANRTIFKIVQEKGIPVVEVLGNGTQADFPIVTCDEAAVSRLVATHFIKRGFQHFAFFGLANECWSVSRRQYFEAALAGLPKHSFSALMIKGQEKRQLSWDRYLRRLCHWVERLPKPVGLMLGSDQFGPDIVGACRHLGLLIPDEVSIVGVDNDFTFCEVCVPSLSSVEPNHVQIGYEAACLLERLMQEEKPPKAPLLIQPLYIAVRRSSDASALDDPSLVKAMSLIRQRACTGLSVDEVAHAAGLSRSVLQRRFRAAVGETVLEVITRVRLSRAKEMLMNTDLSLADIADRSGFKHQEYLGYVFRKELGITPGQVRSDPRHRSGQSHAYVSLTS